MKKQNIHIKNYIAFYFIIISLSIPCMASSVIEIEEKQPISNTSNLSLPDIPACESERSTQDSTEKRPTQSSFTSSNPGRKTFLTIPVPDEKSKKNISIYIKHQPQKEKNCTELYLQCSMNFWRVAEGWFDLGSTMTTAAATLLSGMACISETNTRETFNEAATVCASVSLCLQVFKNFSLRAIKNRKEQWREVLQEERILESQEQEEQTASGNNV